MRLKRIALLGVTIILVTHILTVDGNKQREGKKDKEKGTNQKQRGSNKEEKKESPSSPAERGKGSKGGKSSLQGKFVSKEKADCVWSVSGTETVALNIDCTKGDTKISCTFGGNPSACPTYAANEKSYWKQITRALRKQKNICQDQKAVLKSKECKKGPPEAHLSYIVSSVPTTRTKHHTQGQPKPTPKPDINTEKDCVEDPDVLERQKMAKEYCGDSWHSLCSIFFSMVQSKSC
ncbi:PREDICTED: fibroblast growth factor-binding protein 1 [Nanorana parkeri]|uniref:fibroblast growth factor-binding protein 1 n=1 Tax=Nanorana parkeri TaxID=125878 RepID=UPI0008541812|nr:PREDICTED: fibroblast growth factor-binding protein 1 [Nanorana parkeri]